MENSTEKSMEKSMDKSMEKSSHVAAIDEGGRLDDYVCEIVVCPGSVICQGDEHEGALSTSIEVVSEAELKVQKNILEEGGVGEGETCTITANSIGEVREKLEEFRRKSVDKLTAVHEKMGSNCNSEDDWFKSLKTIHKSVHNGC